MFKLYIDKSLSPFSDDYVYKMMIHPENYGTTIQFPVGSTSYNDNNSNLILSLEEIKTKMCEDIMKLEIPKEFLFQEDLKKILK